MASNFWIDRRNHKLIVLYAFELTAFYKTSISSLLGLPKEEQAALLRDFFASKEKHGKTC